MPRTKYPPLSDYALIGDCHSAALVSRGGSIDWCCLPRFDSDSCFGRLLDWERGGYFEVSPRERCGVRRAYLENTLMLVTTFTSGSNEARLIDFFAMREGGRLHPRRELVRIIEGVKGRMRFAVHIVPRFDFGEVRPWIRRADHAGFVAAGGNTGLIMFGDVALESKAAHELSAEVEVRPGERLHLALQFVAPEELHAAAARAEARDRLAAHHEETVRWWQDWAAKLTYPERAGAGVARSAIVLKALTFAPTGAIIAAPTTSLPEQSGGRRNWDYRFSWIRDSVFMVHALSQLGLEAEAEGFRRFIQRSAAGNVEDLQVLYAVDGGRRMVEIELEDLEGWRRSHPVRIGNGAARQYQADMFGLVLELSWRWSERGRPEAEEYWVFLREIVEAAIAKWRLPDRGIWEIRSRPRHFVHSKVMCWAAVNRGIALAERYSLPAPLERWRAAREQIRGAVESRGLDSKRRHFVQRFGSDEVDAALLLLPSVEFVPYDDPRMVRTVEEIRRQLRNRGLILRYCTEDGLPRGEGVFLPCTFWLAECLAHQGRHREAREFFARASACANELGLFAEEYDVRARELLGNFPQGLTHLAHISAALALNGSPATLMPTEPGARAASERPHGTAPSERSSARGRSERRSQPARGSVPEHELPLAREGRHGRRRRGHASKARRTS
ncbi:MAG TPA: glycoside hydrolase family 15 protein [Steroidobacteraceae bacterium]|nr:glycoside hydrolase family 15 protein [Steroidobacteraceae bacterium]